ncbi:DUF1830 domain-containing protein [Altericista sp. CCNU0014]|uniref:DUF1830 domain-containing protein n=1 Tax=Altericista sp. CCNU0014 TaxID=3082949 RepID=UPI00384DE7FE
MAQLIDPVPSDASDLICCCYINATSKIQIARITNIPNWYFERVVFPGQRLLFEALPEGHLEIHTGMMASAILSDTIPCTQIQITDDEVMEPAYTIQDERRLEARNEGYGQRPVQLESQFEAFSAEPLKFQVAQVS